MTKVKPEIFLDDVGRIVSSCGGKNIWEVKDLASHSLFKGHNLPRTIYVVEFPGRGVGQEFLLGRHLCGANKFLMIQNIGHSMMRLFQRKFAGRVAQFVILWGGRPLDMLDANPPFDTELIDTTYLKLTRVEDAKVSRGWRVVASAQVGQWWPNDTWLVMEECIASGKTLAYFVDEAFKHHKPEQLFVFPVCASAEGLEEINSTCDKNGVEFIPVLNEAIIQVAEKGICKPFTDLGLQPKTIVTREFYSDLSRRYQDTPLCWVGDIGDSLYKTQDYLIETLCDMVHIGMDLEKEDFSKWPDMVRSSDLLERLAAHDKEVYRVIAPAIGA